MASVVHGVKDSSAASSKTKSSSAYSGSQDCASSDSSASGSKPLDDIWASAAQLSWPQILAQAQAIAYSVAEIPILEAVRELSTSEILSDLSAGITIAVMVVPQGLAYAGLAGLSPEIGIYAATVPAVVYAILGGSRQSAIGWVFLSSFLSFEWCPCFGRYLSPSAFCFAAASKASLTTLSFIVWSPNVADPCRCLAFLWALW